MKMFLFILLITAVLAAGCDVRADIQIEEARVFYSVLNNSIKPAKIVMYFSEEPYDVYGNCGYAEDHVQTLTINPGKPGWTFHYGEEYYYDNHDNRIFCSDKVEIYVGDTLIYSCKRGSEYHENILFKRYYQRLGNRYDDYGLFSISYFALLFKWCGNEFCEDQCGKIFREDR